MGDDLTDREDLLLRALLARVTHAVRLRLEASGFVAGDAPFGALDAAMREVESDLPRFVAIALDAPLGIDGQPLATGRVFGRPYGVSRLVVAFVRLEVLDPMLASLRREHEAASQQYHRSSERLRISGVIDGLARGIKSVSAAAAAERDIVRARGRS